MVFFPLVICSGLSPAVNIKKPPYKTIKATIGAPILMRNPIRFWIKLVMVCPPKGSYKPPLLEGVVYVVPPGGGSAADILLIPIKNRMFKKMINIAIKYKNLFPENDLIIQLNYKLNSTNINIFIITNNFKIKQPRLDKSLRGFE